MAKSDIFFPRFVQAHQGHVGANALNVQTRGSVTLAIFGPRPETRMGEPALDASIVILLKGQNSTVFGV